MKRAGANPTEAARQQLPDPLVSVIIPAYNAADFVAEAVRSVLAQDVDGVEILVVNDGSPDSASLEAALEPFRSRIRYLDEPHRGLSRTRNRGIEAARGEFIAFLDADDRWRDGFLERQLHELRETGADLVYCDSVFFGDDAFAGTNVMRYDPSEGEVSLASLLAGRCVVIISTVVARTDRLRAVGGFDPAFAYCEDFDLWIRMLADGASFTYHRAPLGERRMHGGNLSSNLTAMFATALDLIDRTVSTHDFTAAERRDIARRTRRIRADLHRARGKKALRYHDAGLARRELWAAARTGRSVRLAIAALVLAVAPNTALRMLRERYGEPEIA